MCSSAFQLVLILFLAFKDRSKDTSITNTFILHNFITSLEKILVFVKVFAFFDFLMNNQDGKIQ